MKCVACFSATLSGYMAWRCYDCFGDPVLCTPCIQQSHQLHPFHRISLWDGICFFPSSLSNAGVTLNLGHAGRLCPSYNTSKKHCDRDAPYHTIHDADIQQNCSGESIHNSPGVSINKHYSPSGDTHPSDQTPSVDSSTSAKKRKFSSTTISGEVCDPTVQAHYDNRFWESLESQGRDGPTIVSQSSVPDFATPSQQCAPTQVVPNVDISQGPFLADDNNDERDVRSFDPANPSSPRKRGDKKYDELQCPIITVIDTTGIHEIRTRFCRCHPLTSNPLYTQLINMGLYPSSIERTRTVFTFRVLHHFDLTNLEGKTSAWQYYSTLRRLSSNIFPETAVDRYRELMRALRQWRDLTSRRRAGIPFDRTVSLTPGSLALFCPACPQPGINLPANWKDDPEQYVPSFHCFTHSFTMYL